MWPFSDEAAVTLKHDEDGGMKEKIPRGLRFVEIVGNCCWQVQSKRLLRKKGLERRYLGTTLDERQDNKFPVLSMKIIDCKKASKYLPEPNQL